jgi:DNA-binding NarL/FixJ family response regulator/tetratricopeptide (TPR) repeat protein
VEPRARRDLDDGVRLPRLGARAVRPRDSLSTSELVGEPGIGKTRLLAELGRRADGRGLLVLSGSASELDGEYPFWVFVDALDEHVGGLEPRQLDALDDDARPELARVLPSLRPLAAGAGSVLQDERYRTHRAVRQLLEVLTARKPLVLLLDDLHWADSGSIDLLGSLLRRPPAAPVLIAMAVRPHQIPARLLAALERADRARTLSRVELGTLTADESRELLGASISGVAAASLHAASGGNPFYLQQLARAPGALADGAPAADISLAGVDVPGAVAYALTEELALLEPRERRVFEAAAVAGDPFEPELAAAAAEFTEAETLAALDELLRRDLVRETEVPRRFRFRHPLVRRAVYDASPAGWRLGAHERSAEALAATGASAVARAHHVEHAARYGDEAAIAVLKEAGMAVLQRTPAGAARWFAAALRLLPDGAPAPARIELVGALAGARAASGRFEEARAALVECIELAPPQAVPLRVELTVACAGVEQLLGRLGDAHTRLERALASLPDDAARERAALMIELTATSTARTDYDQARAYGAAALDVASAVGEPMLIAAAAATLAFGAASSSSVAEAERHRTDAARLIDAATDSELAGRLSAISELARAELYLDRFAEAAAHVERGLAVARATGQAQLFPVMVPLLGWLRGMSGRLSDSAELLDGAIEAARLAHNRQALAWALFNRAMTALHGGELDAALLLAQESADLTREPAGTMLGCFSGLILGMALVESGSAAPGVQLMIERSGGPDLPLLGGGWKAYFLDWLVRGLLALDRHADAERAADAAASVAATTGLRFAAAVSERAAARIALAAGDPGAAAERALAAAESADELGAAIEAGQARILAGRALAQAGDGERATAALERAAAAFDAMGAPRYRAEAERELGRLGHRRHRRTRAGAAGTGDVSSLTERELEVARLIVDRRTNAQIAAELFLSTKTVETHVRNLFHKLGVSSRVEVARAVERADQRARTLS